MKLKEVVITRDRKRTYNQDFIEAVRHQPEGKYFLDEGSSSYNSLAPQLYNASIGSSIRFSIGKTGKGFAVAWKTRKGTAATAKPTKKRK